MEGCQGTTIQNVLVPWGTQTLYVRGYSSTRIGKSQEETEKNLEEMKKAAPNVGFFIPLSFLLGFVLINESVELSDRRL